MCDVMPGWRRKMLAGEADPAEATSVPPKGFVRLAPAHVPRDRRAVVRRGGGVVLSLLIAVGVGMASLQALIPWASWRAVTQGAGVLVMFGSLGIWARLARRGMAARQMCECERPPVWIRVVPSVAQDRHLPGEGRRGIASPSWGRDTPAAEAAWSASN